MHTQQPAPTRKRLLSPLGIFCAQRGLTLDEVAQRAALDRATLWRWSCGYVRRPNRYHVRAVANVLECTPTTIVDLVAGAFAVREAAKQLAGAR